MKALSQPESNETQPLPDEPREHEPKRPPLIIESSSALSVALGFGAAVLLLFTGTIGPVKGAALFVALVVGSTIHGVHRGRLQRFGAFRWGPAGLLTLGYGAGALVFQCWSPLVWTSRWALHQGSPAALLVSLFLFGFILGFFVVRNWGKEQAEFLKSSLAAFGGAGLTQILGQWGIVDKTQSFASYALGFALSGALNLVVFALLTAHYTKYRGSAERAIIQVLYREDISGTLDEKFTHRLSADPAATRTGIAEILSRVRALALDNLAAQHEARRKASTQNAQDRRVYYRVLSVQQLLDPPGTAGNTPAEQRITILFEEVPRVEASMFRMGIQVRRQDLLAPLLCSDERGGNAGPFPYARSVAGLSLAAMTTIVMSRDRDRKLLNTAHDQLVSPADVEQEREDQWLRYLSYVSVPVCRRGGDPASAALGVITVDTNLFVAPLADERIHEALQRGHDRVAQLTLPLNGLLRLAEAVYDDHDERVAYLDKIAEVVSPVLALYARGEYGPAAP